MEMKEIKEKKMTGVLEEGTPELGYYYLIIKGEIVESISGGVGSASGLITSEEWKKIEEWKEKYGELK
jgi:hypothetical protein